MNETRRDETKLELISRIGVLFRYQLGTTDVVSVDNINLHSGSVRECFPTQNETGKQPVPNDGTESGPGKGCSLMLGTENFPDFFKIQFPGNGIRERRPL